jgi:hypothetical protein
MGDRVLDEELYKLDPGSAEARAEGCICDERGPRVVDGRRAWHVEKDCPLHGLAVAKVLLDE